MASKGKTKKIIIIMTEILIVENIAIKSLPIFIMLFPDLQFPLVCNRHLYHDLYKNRDN